MNITFIISSLSFGGAQKMMLFVAEALLKRNYNISIINLNVYNNFDRKPADGITVITSNIKYKGVITTNYERLKFTIDSVKKLKSDILIGFLFHGNFCASFAGKYLHIPSIISERADPFVEHANLNLLTKIKLKCINSADGAVFQTKGASLFYSEKLQKKSAIIANPITNDNNHFVENYKLKRKSIVTHGRLDNKQKRFDLLIEAFSIFKETHKDFKLKIYGNGPDEGLISELIQKMELDDSVFLMGKVNDPMSVICDNDIYAITSDYEGISNSLLEAMAVGLPVVSTDHTPGGARLLIENEVNGLLVERNNPKSFACALSLFADNITFAEKCGRNARKVLERFSPSNIVDVWDNYISYLINNKND